jgi:hypothetical protein
MTQQQRQRHDGGSRGSDAAGIDCKNVSVKHYLVAEG